MGPELECQKYKIFLCENISGIFLQTYMLWWLLQIECGKGKKKKNNYLQHFQFIGMIFDYVMDPDPVGSDQDLPFDFIGIRIWLWSTKL